jgi:hypothetical protein
VCARVIPRGYSCGYPDNNAPGQCLSRLQSCGSLFLASNSRALTLRCALIDAAGIVAAVGELRAGSGRSESGIASEGREGLLSHGDSAGECGEGRVDCVGGAGSQRQKLAVRAARRLFGNAGRARGGVAVPRSHDGDGADDIVVLVVPDGSRRCRHSSALLCQSLGEAVLLLLLYH